MNVRAARFILGLPAVLATCAIATLMATMPLEGHLRRLAERNPAVEALHRSGARVEIAGRDALITTDFEPSAGLARAARDSVSAIAGVRTVRTTTAVAVAMAPFRLNIRREPGRITLEGGSPPGNLHARLVDAGIVAGGRLRDLLQPALGAPAGFEAAADVALRVAGNLATGQVSLTDGLVAVEGSAPDFARYNAVIAALDELPAGFTLGPFDVMPPQARPFAWAASRAGDVVTLSGYVTSEQARAALRQSAEAELPGLHVVDTMQTARGLDSSLDFTAFSHLAFATLNQIDSGRVALDGRRFSVDGAGTARDLLDEMAAGLRRESPRGAELASVNLRAVTPTPYRFVVERNMTGLTLTGFVPGADTRDAVAGLARRRAADQPVVDAVHLADGSPDGFRTVADIAVEAVTELAEGRATLTDRKLAVAGRSLYPGVAARLRERVASALPPGWSGVADVTADPYDKPLDGAQCGDLLSDLSRREPIRFESGRAEVSSKSRAVLSALASAVARCGSAQIRIVAEVSGNRVAAAGDVEAVRDLADRRAVAVMAALAGGGGHARLAAEGRMAPVAGGSDRVSFEVQP